MKQWVAGLKRHALVAAGSRYRHDQASTYLGLADVLWGLFGRQFPGVIAANADLVIHCHEKDLSLALELTAHLKAKRILICVACQQEVGCQILELPKNRFWVCSTSA